MTQPDRPKGSLWGRTSASQKRRSDILLAAKKVFFESGYQLASIDQIAASAGTTKRTIYDHFGSKEMLFAEVMKFAGEQFVSLVPAVEDLPKSPVDGLRAFAIRLAEITSAPDSLRFQRLIIAEADRYPAMGHALYEAAIRGAERLLVSYLDVCVERGALRRHHTAVSARILLDVATSGPRLRGLFGLIVDKADPTDELALDQAIAWLTSSDAPDLA